MRYFLAFWLAIGSINADLAVYNLLNHNVVLASFGFGVAAFFLFGSLILEMEAIQSSE